MKKKKIGVRFDNYRGAIYCYVTYDRKNTKFHYSDTEIDEEIESELVRSIISYFISIEDDFKLKKLSGDIEFAKERLSEQFHQTFATDFGDIFSYNQYKFLASFLENKFFDNIASINQMLDIQSISKKKRTKLKFEDKNYLLDMDEESLHRLVAFIYLCHFERKEGIRRIHWLLDKKKLMSEFYNFIGRNLDLYKLSGIRMTKGINVFDGTDDKNLSTSDAHIYIFIYEEIENSHTFLKQSRNGLLQ